MSDIVDEKNILEALSKEYKIMELLEFNEFTIEEKYAKNAYLYMYFRDLYTLENAKLDRINVLIDDVKGKLYDHYRFNFDKTLTKSEIEMYYIPRDPAIVKLNKAYTEQKLRVDFFSSCTKAFDKQGWNMKGFLESQRAN